MNKRAIISSLDNTKNTARVILPDVDNMVTGELSIASHVLDLKVNESVIVGFYNSSLTDGAIIGVLR